MTQRGGQEPPEGLRRGRERFVAKGEGLTHHCGRRGPWGEEGLSVTEVRQKEGEGGQECYKFTRTVCHQVPPLTNSRSITCPAAASTPTQLCPRPDPPPPPVKAVGLTESRAPLSFCSRILSALRSASSVRIRSLAACSCSRRELRALESPSPGGKEAGEGGGARSMWG